MNKFPTNFEIAALLCCACCGLTTTALAGGGGLCPPDATGDCGVAHGTPGCDDPVCCNSVCAGDPFCCETEWDSVCVEDAAADPNCNVLSCGNPAAGDCFTSNGTPFCDDADCCNTVCAADSFCCNTEWDTTCVEEAEELCLPQACCLPDGTCVDVLAVDCSGAPQGPLTDCATANCPQPAACCFGDGTCQNLLPNDCAAQNGLSLDPGSDCAAMPCPPAPCINGDGDCFVPNGTLGCNNVECCSLVCGLDPFCCDNQWDQVCADEALANCAGGPCLTCPGDANGDSLLNGLDIAPAIACILDPANGPDIPRSGGCACADADEDGDVDVDDGAALANLLVSDLFGGCGDPQACCFSDATCQDVVPLLCNVLGGVSRGDGTVCAGTICTQACCNFATGQCADIGFADCAAMGGVARGFGTTCATTSCTPPPPCGPGAGPCLAPNGTVGCDDPVCCATVCAADPFCCDTDWDQDCADEAAEICLRACCFGDGTCTDLAPGTCGDLGGLALDPGSDCATATCPPGPCINGDGDCYASGGNGTPGCNDPECCSIICAADPFCCDNEWDGICADEANEMCPNAPPQACCLGLVGECQDLAFVACEAIGGTPQGTGTGCATTTCPAICGGPNSGDCFAANGSVGCDNQACCLTVCAADPFCCETEWDSICVDDALDLCLRACCFSDGSCQDLTPADCTAQGGMSGVPGSDCDTTACPQPIACCFPNGTCLDLQPPACMAQGGMGQGPGSGCATANCPQPRACCFSDGTCQDLLPPACMAQGGMGQGPGTDCATASICPPGACINGDGDCFDPAGNGTPGCNDPTCCSLICDFDPFCCNSNWDDVCADEANQMCPNAPLGACCLGPGNCQELNLGECDLDGGVWLGPDTFCTPESCPSICGDPNAGDCFADNGTPGCNDASCCFVVCEFDPFCCDSNWDGTCAGEAADLCGT